MKNTIVNSFLVIVTLVVILSCSKEKVEGPNDKIAGTWNYESIVIKEPGEADFDYWSLVTAFYSCSKNIKVNFAKDNIFSVSSPSGCVGDDGESFSILPNEGKFELSSDKTKLTMFDKLEPDFAITGDVVFIENKIIWTVKEEFEGVVSTLIVTFKKA